MRRLLLISSDAALEQHLNKVMNGVCAVIRADRDPDSVKRAAADGVSLIAVDGDMVQGLGSVLPEVITAVGRAVPSQPILVLGDEDDALGVLRAIRAGARDVVGRNETADNLRSHLARHLLPATASRAETGGFHLILNSLPGIGSLFAINLAVLRTKASGDGLLIDCTLPASLAPAVLDMRITYTAADAVHDMERMDRMLLASALAQHIPSGLRVLPLAAIATDTVDQLSPDGILALIGRLQAFFPRIIIDAGGIRHKGMLHSLIERATDIHLVASQTITAVQSAHALLDSLDLAADLLGKIVLAVDEHDPAILLTPEQMAATLGLHGFVTVPEARVLQANAVNAGQPLVLAKPLSAYARAVSEIAGQADGSEDNPSLIQALIRLKDRIR